MRNIIRFAAPLILAAACAEPPAMGKPRDQMTQRERDSTIAISGLPGSGVVKKGMAIADGGTRRSAMLDSVMKDN